MNKIQKKKIFHMKKKIKIFTKIGLRFFLSYKNRSNNLIDLSKQIFIINFILYDICICFNLTYDIMFLIFK